MTAVDHSPPTSRREWIFVSQEEWDGWEQARREEIRRQDALKPKRSRLNRARLVAQLCALGLAPIDDPALEAIHCLCPFCGPADGSWRPLTFWTHTGLLMTCHAAQNDSHDSDVLRMLIAEITSG